MPVITREREDNRVYCVDCGRDVTGKNYFLSPTRSPHCARCTQPTALDQLLKDRRIRVLGLQMMLLTAAALWVLDFISGVGGQR
jgi:hypothetical protein